MIPYAKQSIDESDIEAVCEVLRSDWLTTGPLVPQFETALAKTVHATHAISVSNGTAALHSSLAAVGVGPGDEVLVPTLTFLATANAVVFQGATPIFVDVDPETLLIDPKDAERKRTARTKALISVDFAGQACDYAALRSLCDRHGLVLIADACHALGAQYEGESVGAIADLTAFSFHPVKHITTGEGGAVTTDNADYAEKIRRFRNHGIAQDHHRRSQQATWVYEMSALGYNYRLSDLQCALGLSQLKKLPRWLQERNTVAQLYDTLLASIDGTTPLRRLPHRLHAFHLYVVRVAASKRQALFQSLRKKGVGANVHYAPVHLQPYYQENFGTRPGLCPNAEAVYPQLLTLPLYPGLEKSQVKRVVDSVIG